jgi:hypothetical protein
MLVAYLIIFSMFWYSEILGRYFVAFVKTITTSNYNYFGGLLAFKQLEF